ncbi:hypothetical protein DOTSEDRAFT_50478 [Dothistroma septosporum NZE10]|uniref:Uncharacterized protein n=1 Tax=Dothistroma septosporum (strain NZE10 / CBS 128990) TaxID=675120 RepID=N1PXK0_DOTSN|nr:hypothetical protein DOTSEDRAFT_50478 [Dothistroma septosporum NZE10]
MVTCQRCHDTGEHCDLDSLTQEEWDNGTLCSGCQRVNDRRTGHKRTRCEAYNGGKSENKGPPRGIENRGRLNQHAIRPRSGEFSYRSGNQQSFPMNNTDQEQLPSEHNKRSALERIRRKEAARLQNNGKGASAPPRQKQNNDNFRTLTDQLNNLKHSVDNLANQNKVDRAASSRAPDSDGESASQGAAKKRKNKDDGKEEYRLVPLAEQPPAPCPAPQAQQQMQMQPSWMQQMQQMQMQQIMLMNMMNPMGMGMMKQNNGMGLVWSNNGMGPGWPNNGMDPTSQNNGMFPNPQNNGMPLNPQNNGMAQQSSMNHCMGPGGPSAQSDTGTPYGMPMASQRVPGAFDSGLNQSCDQNNMPHGQKNRFVPPEGFDMSDLVPVEPQPPPPPGPHDVGTGGENGPSGRQSRSA